VEPLVYMMMAVSSAVGLVSAEHKQSASSFHSLVHSNSEAQKCYQPVIKLALKIC